LHCAAGKQNEAKGCQDATQLTANGNRTLAATKTIEPASSLEAFLSGKLAGKTAQGSVPREPTTSETLLLADFSGPSPFGLPLLFCGCSFDWWQAA